MRRSTIAHEGELAKRLPCSVIAHAGELASCTHVIEVANPAHDHVTMRVTTMSRPNEKPYEASEGTREGK